ncbi:MAG: DUF6452 family protein [Muribaculum sp.]|nr:DUF6452 family protein [Muribaculum sp.]
MIRFRDMDFGRFGYGYGSSSGGKKICVALLLSVCLLITTSGCNSSECLENGSALPLAGFYTSTINPEVMRVSGMRVRAIGAPGDSVLSTGSSTLTQLYLPFNLDEDTTSYIFEYPEGGGRDTVTFHYIRQPFFVSSECGATVNFNLSGIEHTSERIDSVTCPDGHITNIAVQNIHIYFKYDENQE